MRLSLAVPNAGKKPILSEIGIGGIVKRGGMT
jgi:hypothetical protein